jgi:hypothetical protein
MAQMNLTLPAHEDENHNNRGNNKNTSMRFAEQTQTTL